jgi:hypothetical protein
MIEEGYYGKGVYPIGVTTEVGKVRVNIPNVGNLDITYEDNPFFNNEPRVTIVIDFDVRLLDIVE